MKQDTERKHIDTLTVVYGHAFSIEPVKTIPLGKRERIETETVSAYFPAGRGA